MDFANFGRYVSGQPEKKIRDLPFGKAKTRLNG